MAILCNNVVLTRLIRDGAIDPFKEEEDRDQEEEGGNVMVGCVGEQEENYGDDGCNGDKDAGECLTPANF